MRPVRASFMRTTSAVRRDAAIKAVRERAVPGGDDRGHHAVPTGDIGFEERRQIFFRIGQIAVCDDAIIRLRQIWMRIKSRIEKRYADAFARKSFVRIKPQRRRKHVRAVLLHRSVFYYVFLRPFKEPRAAPANLFTVICFSRCIRTDQFLQIFRQRRRATHIRCDSSASKPDTPARPRQYPRSSVFGAVKVFQPESLSDFKFSINNG